jgi:hypothetical protein
VPRGQPGVPVVLNETRLLSEYLAERFKGQRIIFQARLGVIAPANADQTYTQSELRLLGFWRRYPDAIVLLPDRVVIVEASMRPDPGKISLLDLYARLFRASPDFLEYQTFPIEKLTVWAFPDVATEAMAREHGVRVEVFQPPWVSSWMDSLQPRKARATTMVA